MSEMKVITLIQKYRAILLYLVFGVLTTAVNLLAYLICYHKLGMPNLMSTAIAWLLSVFFAFITNKIWVFQSHSWEISILLYELTTFLSCRIATGVMDLAIMYITVDCLLWNEILWKLLSNMLVILLNFVASKVIIFRKKQR